MAATPCGQWVGLEGAGWPGHCRQPAPLPERLDSRNSGRLESGGHSGREIGLKQALLLASKPHVWSPPPETIKPLISPEDALTRPAGRWHLQDLAQGGPGEEEQQRDDSHTCHHYYEILSVITLGTAKEACFQMRKKAQSTVVVCSLAWHFWGWSCGPTFTERETEAQ